MPNYYRSNFTGQERKARELLLKHKMIKLEELATMTCGEVDQKINDYFNVFLVGEKCEDWMVIPKTKYEEFCKFVTWIRR